MAICAQADSRRSFAPAASVGCLRTRSGIASSSKNMAAEVYWNKQYYLDIPPLVENTRSGGRTE